MTQKVMAYSHLAFSPQSEKPVMRLSVVALVFAGALVGGPSAALSQGTRVEAIRNIVQSQFDRHDLQSLLVEVRIGGAPVLTEAFGDAMTGVPATVEGRFRNGAVGLVYVAALLQKLAEDGMVDLDAPIDRWLPDLPGAALCISRPRHRL